MIEIRTGKHRWIHYFQPPRRNSDPSKDVICHKFPILSWANGCPFSCSYCYLQHTLRRQKHKMVVWMNYEEMKTQIRSWKRRRKKPELLNAGELADSIAIPKFSGKMFAEALEALKGSDGLYLLTKAEGLRVKEWISEAYRHAFYMGNVVLAFSVNADPAAARWEASAPSPDERLAAAMMMKEAGWRVRIRIDPMIPFRGWQGEYENVAEIVNHIKPERVTLGSLRANPGLRRRMPNDLTQYLSDHLVGGKYRIAPEIRAEMYRFIGERLDIPFTLCKETKQMWIESGARGACVCLP